MNYQFLGNGFDSSQHFDIVILSQWKIFTSVKRGFLGNAKMLHKVVFYDSKLNNIVSSLELSFSELK